MKKTHKMTSCYITGIFSLALLFSPSMVQAEDLPTDPWAAATTPVAAPTPAQPQVPQNVHLTVQQVGPTIYGSQPYQPTYEGGEDNIWNTKMPEFTGEMNQWTTNGKFNAPEVNMHNLFSMTYHLRNMGYDIPDSLIEKMRAAPAAAQKRMTKALGDMHKGEDPASKMAQFFEYHFENETGLDVDNLINNSFDLMTSK